MKKGKRKFYDSNLTELRRLTDLYGLEVWKFSDIHFRIVGKEVVDYWPSKGTAWLYRSHIKGCKVSVQELCDLALGVSRGDLLNAGLDAEFRGIMH